MWGCLLIWGHHPFLVRQSDRSLVLALFSARQLLGARAYYRSPLNTSEPSFCLSHMDPGKPTSGIPFNLRPSFLLSVVGDRTRIHKAVECLPTPHPVCQALCLFLTSGLSWELLWCEVEAVGPQILLFGASCATSHPFSFHRFCSHLPCSLRRCFAGYTFDFSSVGATIC